MKTLVKFIAVLSLLAGVALAQEKQPLSGAMDGRAWNAASMSSRRGLTDDISRRLRQEGLANISSEFLLSAINEFYDSPEPTILNTKIAEIVGLTVIASSK